MVAIASVEISGLRGFAQKGTLNLAIPNGKPGSGLTLLVGPNNGGKSTIVEAIRAHTRPNSVSFSVGKRNKVQGGRIAITIRMQDGSSRTIKTRDEGGSETQREGNASDVENRGR